MEGTEEVGMDIYNFGVVGSVRQDVRDILLGGGPSGATVRIVYMGYDLIHW